MGYPSSSSSSPASSPLQYMPTPPAMAKKPGETPAKDLVNDLLRNDQAMQLMMRSLMMAGMSQQLQQQQQAFPHTMGFSMPSQAPVPQQQQQAPARQLVVRTNLGEHPKIITLRSQQTTFKELKDKIEVKVGARVTYVALCLQTEAITGIGTGMAGTPTGALIPIEADADVDDLIHGNVLYAHIEHSHLPLPLPPAAAPPSGGSSSKYTWRTDASLSDDGRYSLS